MDKTGYNQKWQEASVILVAPTFKGFMFNLLRAFISVTSQSLQNHVRLLKFEDKLKRYWSRWLTQKEGNK